MDEKDTKQTALAFIRSLNSRELVEFFYEATSERTIHTKAIAGDSFEIETYIIGQSTWEFGGSHLTDFLALPSSDSAQLEWVQKGENFNQHGACETCKAPVGCIAKEAVCPICKNLVGCT